MKKIIAKLLSYIPTPLPVGMTEFNKWADSIIALDSKYADEDSFKFAIASIIMHLGPQKSRVPKDYFVRSLRKTAANQVAGQVFQDIKEKQKAAQEAAKAAAKAAAADTAPPVVSDEVKQ